MSLFTAYSRLLHISTLEEAKAGYMRCQSEALMLKEAMRVEKVLQCLHLHCVKRQGEQAGIAGVKESSTTVFVMSIVTQAYLNWSVDRIVLASMRCRRQVSSIFVRFAEVEKDEKGDDDGI